MPFSLRNRMVDQAPVDLSLPGGLHGPGFALAQMAQGLHFHLLTSSHLQTPWYHTEYLQEWLGTTPPLSGEEGMGEA